MESKYIYDIALQQLMRTRMSTALRWMEQYGSAKEVWAQLDEPDMQACWTKAKAEIEWINEHRIRVWTLTDDDYPYRLRQCPDRPLVLYGKGNIKHSDGYILSIVGTRRPTQRGIEITEQLVRDLHEKVDKLTIVSGGAYGIDIAAHRAAIKYGLPTIIVPAHGLDRIYPSVHRREAVASLENGGLLTEFVSGTEPLAPYFVQRNRIVAGMADAVVVVESKAKGGSLITAKMAQDYDRDIFAIPGRPTDVLSEGCNKLIRTNAAQLIQNADDIINFMAWKTKETPSQPIQTQMVELFDELTSSQQAIIRKLQNAEDGMHVNLIVMETAQPYGEVASDLLLLEMQGWVKALPGGIYRFIR